MKRGLVIGKFRVVHEGHVALIRFAAAHCDELIVSMSYKANDPIPLAQRYQWLTEIFNNETHIKIETVADDFDDEQQPLTVRTKLWAEFIRNRYPKIDVIFSSEEYGEPFAQHLGSKHITFDPARNQFPISSTRVLEKPFTNWKFLPVVVRPYFVRKICFYGPESTGKTTMAIKLASHYQTEFVPEVSRELTNSNAFTLDEIVKIGEAQTQRIKDKIRIANKILFCDSDLITTQIYSEYYLHRVPPVLKDLEKQIKYDLYFFFEVDVPWVADGLRDLGSRRDEMRAFFKKELDGRNIPFVTVQGTWQEREQTILHHLNHLIQSL